MAAATASAAAAIFSNSNYIKSKAWPSSDPMFLRITSAVPMLQVSSHSIVRTDPIPISGIALKWRLMRVSASVAQEEAAVSATEVEQTTEQEEEEEQVAVKEEEQLVPSGDQATINTKLYFGNLPYHCDSAQLAGIIQDYGSPELVEVLYDRGTGKSRGFAFATMSSIEDCNCVIENLDGREYGGRTLRVNYSDKPKVKEALYPETEHKLFVGNLSWSVTSESLIQMFGEYGNVVGARVLYDGDTGRSRGYGFVSYSTKSEMDMALEALNGVELEGRSMRVSLAQGKRQ